MKSKTLTTIILTVIAVSLLFSLSLAAKTKTTSGPKITFVVNEEISEDKLTLLRNSLLLDDFNSKQKKDKTKSNTIEAAGISAMSFNILCLFGHDMQYGNGYYIEHFVYPTSPKCKKVYFDYGYCKRSGCDYVTQTTTNVVPSLCH